METTGRRALVTGAAIRVGREIALELARAGFGIYVHFRASEVAAPLGEEAVALIARTYATLCEGQVKEQLHAAEGRLPALRTNLTRKAGETRSRLAVCRSNRL